MFPCLMELPSLIQLFYRNMRVPTSTCVYCNGIIVIVLFIALNGIFSLQNLL